MSKGERCSHCGANLVIRDDIIGMIEPVCLLCGRPEQPHVILKSTKPQNFPRHVRDRGISLRQEMRLREVQQIIHREYGRIPSLSTIAKWR